MASDSGQTDQPTPAERVAALGPMLADPDPRVRKSAVIALGRMMCPEATEALCRLLDDATEGVRVLTCQALGRAADPESVPSLVAHVHDPSAEVRAGVLWAFANVAAHGGPGGTTADPAVRAALFTPVVVLAFDPDDGVRADAAAVLGTLRDDRTADALLALLDDACPRVRANACASLGLLDDAAGLEALLAVAERPSEGPLVLVSALDGLARRAERGSIPAGSPAAARAVAAACALAVPAMGEGAPAGGLTVGDGSGNPGDGPSAEDVRATAVWALGMFADLHGSRRGEVRTCLEGALAAGGWTTRYAVESLARLHDKESYRALRSFADGCASGADPDIARVLDRALATFGEIS